MGEANRRSKQKEVRVAQAIEREDKKRKRAFRFVHLYRFIQPKASRDSIISCGRNRGFVITSDMEIPPVEYKDAIKILPLIGMLGAAGFSENNPFYYTNI